MGKKIKSTSMFKYDYLAKSIHAKDIEKKGYKHSYTEFDKNGNPTLEVKYDSDAEMEEKYVRRYDDKSNLIEDISYLTEDDIAEHKTYERGENGKTVKAFKHYNDGSKDTIEYKYDDDGNLTEKVTIDSFNEIEATEVFTYESGKVIAKEITEYDEVVLKETFVTDNDDNILEQTKWTEEDGMIKFVNEFDDQKNLYKAKIYNNKNQLAAQSTYKYNKEGKVAEIIEESPRGVSETKIEYDEKGNPISQVETNPAGKINNKAERKFNENNDVIETVVFIDLQGAGVNQNYVLKYEYSYYN